MSALLVLALAVSGLRGVVTRGPTQPVCQVSTPCSTPAVGVELVFSRGGQVVTRARTGSGGRYAVRLAPGDYAVRLQPQPKIGTGLRPRTVRVPRGAQALVNFFVDTGIR